jgi:ketosteroid isomerase-like protein
MIREHRTFRIRPIGATDYDRPVGPTGDVSEGAGSTAPPPASSPVDTVRHIQEALGRGDILAPMAHLSRNVRWAVSCSDRDAAPFFQEYTGRQGVVAFMQAMDVVDMTAFDIKAVVGEGDLVFVWLHMAFTAPTGRTVDMDETQVWTFSDGKVISVDLFPDTKAVAEAFA